MKTADPEVFKSLFKTLSASGGGDNQELSLSALQVLFFFLCNSKCDNVQVKLSCFSYVILKVGFS